MALEPKASDLPKIPGALKLYQVASIITGVLLLALCVEMLLKYAFGLELELGGAYGFLAFVPSGSVAAINLSIGVLVVHGWFYVVYLFADFRLWSLMRWPLMTFVLIALGGVVPFLSFIVEARMAKRVRAYLAQRQARDDQTRDAEAQEATH
ncbi:DUF3817 domain-containing protein [Paramicrobacterium chengjingii]|uniref:DUF3817 domain-containing protein n=1 Tax=Paramicrobacterium chengjingii TaxID=2769067 RepID=A0ABX6YK67_9MICO|nr:DUF3817 domain-containing protein [Microbacterium chengjingii]QPZ39203.1 DUF3817 domain-containing protein [Microbacterium chengjingii]